uniref:Uncharacterized protein LOC111101075 n=1 Tax=Crassostrea virginica TaxID=6565 RepID=A0A8B8AEX5_CRAVI|nr:uncharacterized protein LOC111101075 [Crassostrea virginica]
MAPNLVGTPGVVNSLINTVQSLQTMVSSLASMVTSKETNANASFSLQNYYHSNAIQSPPSQTARKFGTNPEDLPQMDLISPSIRKNIVEDAKVQATGTKCKQSTSALPSHGESPLENPSRLELLVSNSISSSPQMVYNTGLPSHGESPLKISSRIEALMSNSISSSTQWSTTQDIKLS